MKELGKLSDAQHALLCEVIAGRVIVEELHDGKIRYFTAKIDDRTPFSYHRPRYIRNNETVFVLLENALLKEFILWDTYPHVVGENYHYPETKGYTYSEKAFGLTAACAAHRKDRRKE